MRSDFEACRAHGFGETGRIPVDYCPRSFRSDIARRKAGSARGENHIYFATVGPYREHFPDGCLIVREQSLLDNRPTLILDQLRECWTRRVCTLAPRGAVGDSQNPKTDRHWSSLPYKRMVSMCFQPWC